jgi:hypothetical protein
MESRSEGEEIMVAKGGISPTLGKRKNGEYRICIGCGKQFWLYKCRNQNRKYCSQECRVKYDGKKIKCVCEHCGKEYFEWKYRIEKQGSGRFCSRACAKPHLGSYAKARKGKKGIYSEETLKKMRDAKQKWWYDTENSDKQDHVRKTLSESAKKNIENSKKANKIRLEKWYIEHPEKHPDVKRKLKEERKRLREEKKNISDEEKLIKKQEKYKRKNELRNKKRKKLTIEEKREIFRKNKLGEKNPNFGKKLSEPTIEKRTISCKETEVGGFWYGNVKYYERVEKVYCELWKPELCERIRAAWNYKSAISGKTREDNKGKALSCHHVYYQTKACCVWDEDIGGYYAWINLGTKKNPDMYKHYIKGDPNKFVPLTRGEHSATNSHKLFWILYFEDIIARKPGKCYLSKDEMKTFFNNTTVTTKF